jgi:hypothetical protein
MSYKVNIKHGKVKISRCKDGRVFMDRKGSEAVCVLLMRLEQLQRFC